MSPINPLIISAAASVAEKGLNYLNNKSINEQSFSNQVGLLHRQDYFQRNLIHDLPSINKAALRDAGFSVASLSDGFQSANSNAVGSNPTLQPTDFSGLGSGVMDMLNYDMQSKNSAKQREVMQSEIDKNKAEEKRVLNEAEGKKISNDVAKREYDNETMMSDLRNQSLLDIQLKRARDRGDFSPEEEASIVAKYPNKYMSKERYEYNRGLYEADVDARLHESQANLSRYVVAENMYRYQLDDEQIIKSLAYMPFKEYEKITETVRSLKNDNDFFELVKDFRYTVERVGADEALKRLDLLAIELENARKAQPLVEKQIAYDSWKIDKDMKWDLRQIVEKIMNSVSGSDSFSWKDGVRLLIGLGVSLFGSFGQSVVNRFVPNRSSSSVVISGGSNNRTVHVRE